METRDSADLISPDRLKVQAVNRKTQRKTIPIEVSGRLENNFDDLARFVCQVLMIEPEERAESALLMQTA